MLRFLFPIESVVMKLLIENNEKDPLYICMEVLVIVYQPHRYSCLLSRYFFTCATASLGVSLFPIWLKKISECTTSVL